MRSIAAMLATAPFRMRVTFVSLILAISPPAALSSTAAWAQAGPGLSYFAPGNILPVHVGGIDSRAVAAPDWHFPMQVGSATGHHAYIGTQLSQYHGLSWNNDPRLFAYPHRDNQCEPRKWKVRACPSGKGHQGVDIRAHDNSNRKWNVVAVEDGVVTSVTKNTTVSIRSGTRTVRYLHMDAKSIQDAGIAAGKTVVRGQVLGKVSNIMNGSPNTSLHLHFDAYTGVAAKGNFYHVYPSLIAAYRRAWGLPDLVEDGALKADKEIEVGTAGTQPPKPPKPDRPVVKQADCATVALSLQPLDVDRNAFSSFWQHNCSIMGLAADTETGERSFVYFQPRQSIAGLVASEPVLFAGTNAGGAFSGTARHYSTRCGAVSFPVTGLATQVNGNPAVILQGSRPQRDSETCQEIGSVEERLEFSYLERTTPVEVVVGSDPTPPGERKTLSELTRNFLAITFYPGNDGKIELLPYFASFPGLDETNGKTDSKGGLIPALSTDEGGVAVSWVWINKRARYTDGLSITPRAVAHSMAGVDPSTCDAQIRPTLAGIAGAGGEEAAAKMCLSVSAYLSGYIGFGGGRNFAVDYFGRQVTVDETLNLGDPAIAWNWMRTMYSHESGRPVVIGRDAFIRGMRFGADYISHFYDGETTVLKPIAFYSDPCNFGQPACAAGGPDGEGEEGPPALKPVMATLKGEIEALTEENRKLGDLVRRLERRLSQATPTPKKTGGVRPNKAGNARTRRPRPLY